MLEMVLTFMANVGLTLTTRRADAVKQWWPLGTNVARAAHARRLDQNSLIPLLIPLVISMISKLRLLQSLNEITAIYFHS